MDLYSNYIGDSKSDIAHYGRKGMKKGMNIFNPDYVPIGEVARGPMYAPGGGETIRRKKPSGDYREDTLGNRMRKKPSGDYREDTLGNRMRKKPGNASAAARAKLGGRRGRDNEFDRNSDRDSYDRRPAAASADRRSGKKKPTEESGPRAHINRRTATSKRPLWFHDGVGERENQSGDNRTRPTSRGYSNSGRKPRIIPNSESVNTTSTPNRRKKPSSSGSNSRSLGSRQSNEYRNENSRANLSGTSRGGSRAARPQNASSEYYEELNSNSRSNRRRRRG